MGDASKSTARSTASGPAQGVSVVTDAATAKHAGTEAVASAFPFNAAKPSEFGERARDPAVGQAVEPPHPLVSGSTLTEINASQKVGSGNPQVSFNPGNASLDRVRVDSGGRVLTTNQGVPVADNQNSLKAGFRGPALLEDFILREKITHFDHERIPERIVHARGSGAHGYFECYAPLTELTRASIFAEAGKRTPGVRPLFHGRRRARLHRYRARRPRVRRQVLHRRRQLGSRRQQHPGVLHPGRDEVPRPHSLGQAGAAPRDAAGRLRARHVLGLRLADARIHPHADVGHVGPRDPAQLSNDAGIRRSHVPLRERGRRVALRQVPLESRRGHALPGLGRSGEDFRGRSRIFTGATCGRRSRPARSRNGSSASRSSPRSRRTDSHSTCWTPPRSFRRSWCR